MSYQKELCISWEAAVTEMYERMKSEMKKMPSSLPAAVKLVFLCECDESVTGPFTGRSLALFFQRLPLHPGV